MISKKGEITCSKCGNKMYHSRGYTPDEWILAGLVIVLCLGVVFVLIASIQRLLLV